MAAKDNPCRKFQANIFNKSKCQNCFKPRESHLLNDEDLNQVGSYLPPLPPLPQNPLFSPQNPPPGLRLLPAPTASGPREPWLPVGCPLAPWVARGPVDGVEPRGCLMPPPPVPLGSLGCQGSPHG